MAVFKPHDIFAGRYQLQKLLGLGGFSEVWQVIDQMAENTILALKIYAAGAGLDEDGIELFRREYSLTLPLNHKNLLKPTYFDIYEGSPYLVMPLCEKGSLTKKLFRQGTMSETDLALMISNVSDGLTYLHQRAPVVLHQDIKPDNVLITAKDEYLLSDFGISSRMRHTMMKSTRSTSSNSLTIAYAPPEKFSNRPKSMPASDIFSFGVMMYELCTNEVPWMGHGGQSLLTGSAVPELPEQYSAEFNKIVQACMNLEPAQRPTAQQLHGLTLAYLDKGQWEDFEVITHHKATSFPVGGQRSGSHPENTSNDNDAATSAHKTDAHPDLNLDDAIIGTPTEDSTLVVRPERVTEAVDSKKGKAANAPKKRTFDRNVYIFLGIMIVLLVGLIGREYTQKGNNDAESKGISNFKNDNLDKSLPTVNKDSESQNNADKKRAKADADAKAALVAKEETKTEESIALKEENEENSKKTEAKDMQDKMRLIEKEINKQLEAFEEKNKDKQPFSKSEVIGKRGNHTDSPKPPFPPKKSSVVISKDGIVIDENGKLKSKSGSLELNLSKDIVELVKEAIKNDSETDKKRKLEELGRKMSKKYEKLSKRYTEKYNQKRSSHRKRHQDSDKEKSDYKEKYTNGFLINRNNKWGYLDRKGREIIPPRFEKAWPFHEGLAAVRMHGKWGYINRNGHVVIGYKFDRPGHFKRGQAKVIYRGKRIYINRFGNCVGDCQ